MNIAYIIWQQLRPYTKVFLIAETLDYLTTLVGLFFLDLGLKEVNTILNFWVLLIVKFIAVIFVAWRLDNWKYSKKIWVVPVIALLPAIWNIGVILVHVFA